MKIPLFLPFIQEILPFPQAGERFIGYGLHEAPDTIWQPYLDIIQPWRPDYLRLAQAGFMVLPQAEEKGYYDGGLLLLDKHRKRNENRLLHLLRIIRPGGRIIICGDKTSGAASLRKWAAQITPVEDSLSKSHAIVFWLAVPEQPDSTQFAACLNPPCIIDNQFETRPGMFSHGRVDAGSALLARSMPDRVQGTVADFGAGWGYLSALALKQIPAVTALDLYEADYDALQVARSNLANISSAIPIEFHWLDLIREQPPRQYDTIFCNPPFHERRAADVSLGYDFIRKAALSLKTQGQLLMVANQHLPYEAILNQYFSRSETLVTENGFKIIYARK